jgi:hypothetical protein
MILVRVGPLFPSFRVLFIFCGDDEEEQFTRTCLLSLYTILDPIFSKYGVVFGPIFLKIEEIRCRAVISCSIFSSTCKGSKETATYSFFITDFTDGPAGCLVKEKVREYRNLLAHSGPVTYQIATSPHLSSESEAISATNVALIAASCGNAAFSKSLAIAIASAGESATATLNDGSCAILCPSEGVGKELASGLSERGLEATFMKGSDLNLTRPGVKILTLQSAKGLEFPIVALAGFIGSNYPVLPFDVSPEQREELLAKERRILFVGMTRAMRALLVVTPVNPDTELMRGFDPTRWNLNRSI